MANAIIFGRGINIYQISRAVHVLVAVTKSLLALIVTLMLNCPGSVSLVVNRAFIMNV